MTATHQSGRYVKQPWITEDGTPVHPRQACADCPPGEERIVPFYSKLHKRSAVQYDYRDLGGTLFSVVRGDVESCRIARDVWLRNNGFTLSFALAEAEQADPGFTDEEIDHECFRG